MEELESHQDEQDTPDSPCHGAAEEQQVFSYISRNESEGQENNDGSDAERHGQFQDVGERQVCCSAREIADQSQAQDAVARADTGNKAEDKNAKDRWIESRHFTNHSLLNEKRFGYFFFNLHFPCT